MVVQGLTINPEMLILARESRGYTQASLAKALGFGQGKVSKTEAGLLGVSSEDLERLSTLLHYPPKFFYSKEPVFGPATSEFYHRSLKRAPRKRVSQIYATLNIRIKEIGRLLRSIEWDTTNQIKHIDIDEFDGEAGKIAQSVRAEWMLARGPIKNITATIEDAGGIVVPLEFNTKDIDGISRWIPGLPPIFFVNKGLYGDRLRFTLAHELGHVIMHRSPTPTMEQEANRFAGEFLMPSPEVKHHLQSVSLPDLANLKAYWKVSMGALLHRAQDLQTISYNQARYLWLQMAKAGYTRREPALLDIPFEPPVLLKEIRDFYSTELNYTIEDLSDLIDLYPDELDNIYSCQSSQPNDDSRHFSIDVNEAIREAEQIIRDHREETNN